eukprot:snap_masked-scaffold_8-processed-gene-14.66-mRNA-1 protein AED:1.00 eAED:1.00 QI:0/0/0/0/1/1/2/0/289
MQRNKPNKGLTLKRDEEESSTFPHYSLATSLASVYSDESTSTKILGMPAAAESVRGSRSSIKAHNPMSPRELEEAKKKAIKEYKKMPQFLQYAGEIIKRDKELEKRGEWIEISKEPQRIYDAMQEKQKKKERKKQLKKRLFKYGLPAFLLLVLIISSITVLLSSNKGNNSAKESKPDKVDIPQPEPDSKTLICEDQVRLCDFEVKELCQTCGCLQSLEFFKNGILLGQPENAYVVDIKGDSNILTNAKAIRDDLEFGGDCDSCTSTEKTQCESEKAECCFDILNSDTNV